MFKVNLLQKTMLIIVLNVLAPIILGFVIRSYNASLYVDEQEARSDGLVIQQVAQAVQHYHSEMRGRVTSIASLLHSISLDPNIVTTRSTQSPVQSPSQYMGLGENSIQKILELDGLRQTDFFGVADLSGNRVEISLGQLSVGKTSLLKNTELPLLLNEIRNTLEVNAGRANGIFHLDGFAVAYAAVGLNESPLEFPNIYFIAKKIDEPFIELINKSAALQLTLMSRKQWQSSLDFYQVLAGERAANGKVYFSLIDSQGKESVWLSFSGEKVSKQAALGSAGLLFIVLGIILWGVTIRFLTRQLILPISRLADHLREVRINNDYSRRLTHQSRGDMRRLYDEFNALVAHVEDYTDELKISSYTDGLTNVGNQRLFSEKLDTYWSLGLRGKKNLCILHFDIDYFKQYNDHYGHQKGNELLINIAQHMQRVFCRESDVVARVGGDEFAVLLFDIELNVAHKLATALLEMVTKERRRHPAKQGIGFATLSGGVAGVIPNSSLTAEQLMRQSDQALYRAKGAGRNCVQVYRAE